jgi:hypothetical protein
LPRPDRYANLNPSLFPATADPLGIHALVAGSWRANVVFGKVPLLNGIDLLGIKINRIPTDITVNH